MYSRAHADFSSWAWGVMLTLKLHQCDNMMNETTEAEEIVIEGITKFFDFFLLVIMYCKKCNNLNRLSVNLKIRQGISRI